MGGVGAAGRLAVVARRLVWASLGLAPITIIARFAFDAGDVALFVLAAISLVPLAWLIGEATEHAAKETGPGIGGFINATFGNAPELIIALFAVDDGLVEVVRGSLTGSVVGNLLLVLGASLIVGPTKDIDRRSALSSIGLVFGATLLFTIVAATDWNGGVTAHTLQVLSIPVSVALLIVYVGVTTWQLRRHRQLHASADLDASAWPLRMTLAILALATAATAVIAEILVGSIEVFAEKAHLSDFFVAAVIVAIVGNAAEHGGAVIVAHRGRVKLATEIAVSSSAQVAVFLIPAVAVISWAINPLSLAFRQVEIAVMGCASLLAGLMLVRGRSSSWRGWVLTAAYAVAAAAFYKAGGR
jgi:Ca2+:H+ antiporter